MFGLFKPKCPLSLFEKAWIEWRWRWLGEQLGWQIMLDAPVYSLGDVPGADQQRLSQDEVQTMFRFIAQSMQVDPKRVRLIVLPADEMLEAGGIGLYLCRGDSTNPLVDSELSTILLSDSELNNPPSTVATLAHELAHEVLLGGEILDAEDDSDCEWLTDLLPLFFGYGLFLSNDTLREVSGAGYIEAFHEMSRKGYLVSRMFGYGLALFALHRREQKPDWIRLLRLDARKRCTDGLRFLRATQDILTTPDDLLSQSERQQQQVGIAVENLSPTQRLGRLWDLGSSKPKDSQTLVSVATKLLADEEKDIRIQAVIFLSDITDLPDESLVALEGVTLDYNEPSSRIQAILILSNNDSLPDDAFAHLVDLLKHSQRNVVENAAHVIGQLADKHGLPSDQPRVIKTVIEVAEKALRVSEDLTFLSLHPALKRIPNFFELVRENYPHWSEERISELFDFANSNPSSNLPPK